MNTKWLAIAAINGFLAVAAGAFGAHALKGTLDADAMNAFDVGVRYQMYHALALLAAASDCQLCRAEMGRSWRSRVGTNVRLSARR